MNATRAFWLLELPVPLFSAIKSRKDTIYEVTKAWRSSLRVHPVRPHHPVWQESSLVGGNNRHRACAGRKVANGQNLHHALSSPW